MRGRRRHPRRRPRRPSRRRGAPAVTSLALGAAPDVPLSRINPVAQLTAMVVVTLVLVTSLDVVTPAVVVAAELCLLPAAGLSRPGVLLRRTWPLLVGAASVGVVNVALSPDATPVTGIGLALRVVGLALPGVLLVSATDPVRLADALTLHWRGAPRPPPRGPPRAGPHPGSLPALRGRCGGPRSGSPSSRRSGWPAARGAWRPGATRW